MAGDRARRAPRERDERRVDPGRGRRSRPGTRSRRSPAATCSGASTSGPRSRACATSSRSSSSPRPPRRRSPRRTASRRSGWRMTSSSVVRLVVAPVVDRRRHGRPRRRAAAARLDLGPRRGCRAHGSSRAASCSRRSPRSPRSSSSPAPGATAACSSRCSSGRRSASARRARPRRAFVVVAFAVAGAVNGSVPLGQESATHTVQVMEALFAVVTVTMLLLGADPGRARGRRGGPRRRRATPSPRRRTWRTSAAGSGTSRDDRITWSDELYRLFGVDPGAELTYEGTSRACTPTTRPACARPSSALRRRRVVRVRPPGRASTTARSAGCTAAAGRFATPRARSCAWSAPRRTSPSGAASTSSATRSSRPSRTSCARR